MLTSQNSPLVDDTAECVILAAILAGPEPAAIAFEALAPGDFGSPARAKLYLLLRKMSLSGDPLDEIAARGRIARLRPTDSKLCMDALEDASQFDVCAQVARFEPQIPIVKELAARRLALRRAGELQIRALDRSQDIFKAFKSANAEVEARDSRAVVKGSVDDLYAQLDDAVEGKRFNVPFPWPQLTEATQAMLPGNYCVLAGGAGASKSLMAVQFLYHIHRQHKCALLVLEDGTTSQMRRVMAQICRKRELLDEKWCRLHAADVARLKMEAREKLESFAGVAQELHPDERLEGGADYRYVLDWCERQLQAGCRVIAIDPFSYIDFEIGGGHMVSNQTRFLFKLSGMLGRYGASALLVTHPKNSRGAVKGTAGNGLHDVAGSTKVTDAARCVLFLQYHAEKLVAVDAPGMPKEGSYTSNVTIHIAKANYSWGGGKNFGFFFDRGPLEMLEIGMAPEKASPTSK